MTKKITAGVFSIFVGLVLCENVMATPKSVETFFLITKQGQSVYDKERRVVNNRLLLYVSVTSSKTVVNEVPVVIEAVAETAENKIADNIKKGVDLPELVYESIQNVSKKVFAIYSAKTNKEFDRATKEYEKAFDESDSMISLHGFRLVKHLYTFRGVRG